MNSSHKRLKERSHRYNWKPDLPDQRDILFSTKFKTPSRLPKSANLRPLCSPVFNQGKIGSCTGNALAGALEFLELQELRKLAGADLRTYGKKFEAISRLFIYFNERALEGTTDSDAGANLRDGIKSLTDEGACRESLWKYQASLVFKKPPLTAYSEARLHKISAYYALNTLHEMKQSLAMGYPFVFGFAVYESFESPLVARTGKVPMPDIGETVLGGHAVMAVGFDDVDKTFMVRNSWGEGWGDHGYCYMPYEYLQNPQLAMNFWVLEK